MIHVNENKSIDEPIYYGSSKAKQTSSVSFDSILEEETIIYATPATDSLSSTSNGNGLSAPKELETYFQRAADKYGIDMNLLKAVAKTESNFNAGTVSSAGAIGVMQLMPSTASSLGVQNPYNAEENIMGGAKYLSQLLQKYNGSLSLTLAAYNAGSGNVDKYNGIPPFTETQNYVKKVLGYYGNPSAISYPNTLYAMTAEQAGIQDSSTVSILYAVAAKDAGEVLEHDTAYAASIYAVAARDAAHIASIPDSDTKL